MSKRFARSPLSLVLVLTAIAIAVVTTTPARAAGTWRWCSGHEIEGSYPIEKSVTDGYTRIDTPSGNTILYLDLHLPPNVTVDSLAVCFGGATLNGIKILEYSWAAYPATRFSDGNYYSSAINGTCYSLDVPDFVPTGVVTLQLRSVTGTFILVYSIGVKLAPSLLAVSNPAPERMVTDLRNAPNPFGGTTTIDYVLVRAGAVRVQVYDAAGRSVRAFDVGHQSAGAHRVDWDGRAEDGRALEPGVYYYELVTPTGREARRAVMLR